MDVIVISMMHLLGYETAMFYFQPRYRYVFRLLVLRNNYSLKFVTLSGISQMLYHRFHLTLNHTTL